MMLMKEEEPGQVAKRGVLGGRVQGVGFRYFVYRRALEAGIKGWVKNLHNGDVEAHIEGSIELVDDFQQVIQQGPPLARIIEYNWNDVPVQGFHDFEITF